MTKEKGKHKKIRTHQVEEHGGGWQLLRECNTAANLSLIILVLFVLPPSQGFVLIFYVLLHMLGTWETIYLTDIEISEQAKLHGDAVF